MSVVAADWPQWRGPNRDGISPEKGLLKTWPKDGPRLQWTFEKGGTGYATPAVVGDRIYLSGARDNTEVLIALSTAGKELWAGRIGPTFDFQGNSWSRGPNATPLVNGGLVHVVGSGGDLVCFDAATGKEKWRSNLPATLSAEVNPVGGGPPKMGWGFSWSPLVDGDNLIITPGGPKGLVAALNKKTGAVVWQSKGLTDQATYASPMLTTVDGVRMVVAMVQNGAVGVSAANGDVLWEHRLPTPYPDVVCSTPLVKDNFVYLSVGYGVGAELLKLTRLNGKFQAQSVYTAREIGNKQGGVVLIDGYVYGFHDNRSWMCQEFKTGALKWESNRRALKAGSVLYADGRLYCHEEDKNQVAMLAASPAAYKEIAKFTLPKSSPLRKDRAKAWTHPVLSDGMLYIRDQELLFCYRVK